MPHHKIETSPLSSGLFVHYDRDILKLFDIGTGAANRGIGHVGAALAAKIVPTLTCMDWCSDVNAPRILSYGNMRGDVYIINWDTDEEVRHSILFILFCI